MDLYEMTIRDFKSFLKIYGIDGDTVTVRDGYDFKVSLDIVGRSPLGDYTNVHTEQTMIRIVEEKKEDENAEQSAT